MGILIRYRNLVFSANKLEGDKKMTGRVQIKINLRHIASNGMYETYIDLISNFSNTNNTLIKKWRNLKI